MVMIGKGSHGSNEVLISVIWRLQMNSHIHAEYLHSIQYVLDFSKKVA